MSDAAQPPAQSRSPARTGVLRPLLLVLASLFFSLLLCELLLRIAWENPFQHEGPDRIVLLRTHHANSDRSYERTWSEEAAPIVRFRTDADSFILPSRRFEAPDYTIVFFGGSTTECVALDEDERFPALVSTLLEQKGLRVNALNVARSGTTAHDSLNVLLNHVVREPPDVVVLMHAVNDIGVLARGEGYGSRMAQSSGLASSLRWPLQTASSWSSLAGLVRRWATWSPRPRAEASEPPPGTVVVGSELAEREFAPRLRSFVRVARAFGSEPVLMTQPSARFRNEWTPSWVNPNAQDEFNEVVRRVGRQERATVIDLARYLATQVPGWDEPGRVFFDGLHINEPGSRLYAEYIAERLMSSVLGRRGNP